VHVLESGKSQAKRQYLKYCNENKFLSTDVVPLVNMALPHSFAKKENARKAVLKQGWNPLNYVLLDHPKLLHTQPELHYAEQ
jgi:hypothetical protein